MAHRIYPLFALSILLCSAGPALARDQIRVVGSSTVFPFSTSVAERFGKTTAFQTPVVESTGSGGGLKLFCSGVGEATPDIANSSRRIKLSEVTLCEGNGVAEIVEIMIGYDGIVFASLERTPCTTREEKYRVRQLSGAISHRFTCESGHFFIPLQHVTTRNAR